ncbi:recombinase family protein [Nonomuraea sp. NPDC050556]|uniref:recombinase family protein n=1 Tax=Nonomuraea sp. NPDC050556 TaxID=3364369 RepID=UPI003791D2A1
MAINYHTARFRLVRSLAKALTVVTPPIRKPGTPWIELPRPASSGAELSGHVRIGYARASTARQSLDTQLDSLTAAGVTKIFSEKISTRAVSRPELDRAVEFARELRAASLGVTLVVHEHKRLGRGLALCATITDDAMLSPALHLREKNLSLREIAAKLVVTKGKKKGRHPSPATVLRMLREHDEADEDHSHRQWLYRCSSTP